jgi:hypothetical protein
VVGKPVRVQIPPSAPSQYSKGIWPRAKFPFFVKWGRLDNFWLVGWTTRKKLLFGWRNPNIKMEDYAMINSIQWLPDLNAASKKAQTEKKYVLLDFFNPR